MISIDAIARLANVSKSTVSKALNGRPDVSETTKTRILEIANEHHYSPNIFSKSLKSKHTRNIGVIFTRERLPLSNNPFFSRILEGIEAELAVHNYNLFLNIIPDNTCDNLPKMIRERHVDGIILIGIFSNTFIDQLMKKNIDLVQVDPKQDRPDFSQIMIDNEHGGYLATEYLLLAGHRRIAFISGELSRLSFEQRLTGYKKAMTRYEVPIDDRFIAAYGVEEGYQQVRNLIETIYPTAIVCGNDMNALHGYKAIHDLHMRIPENISIIGFDDIAMSSMAVPPLTTIRVYKEELGSLGARTLLKTIHGDIRRPTNIVVPVKLVERESVRHYNETKIKETVRKHIEGQYDK